MTTRLPYRRAGRHRGVPAVEFDTDWLSRLIRDGAPNADIADAFYCCQRTFERWRARNPDVNDMIKQERARAAEMFAWTDWSRKPRLRTRSSGGEATRRGAQ